MKITTKTGFKFNLDDKILADWRFIDAIAEADSTDEHEKLRGTRTLIGLMFGDEKDRLIEHVMKKNGGYAPIDAIRAEMESVLTKYNETKNSQSSQA